MVTLLLVTSGGLRQHTDWIVFVCGGVVFPKMSALSFVHVKFVEKRSQSVVNRRG